VSTGAHALSFADTTVSPGRYYAYRLAWTVDATPHTTAEVWVHVPEVHVEPARAFALIGACPNPASGRTGVLICLDLPDDTPATLELLDVTGRRVVTRVVTRDVPPSGALHQTVNVSEGLALESGIYFVRLSHGGHSLTRRVAVVGAGSGGR
jgi:hypothetical protein